MCSAALRLMLQILNWDFRCNKNPTDVGSRGMYLLSDQVNNDIYSMRRTECNLSQVTIYVPPKNWINYLLDSPLTIYGCMLHNLFVIVVICYILPYS